MNIHPIGIVFMSIVFTSISAYIIQRLFIFYDADGIDAEDWTWLSKRLLFVVFVLLLKRLNHLYLMLAYVVTEPSKKLNNINTNTSPSIEKKFAQKM